MKILELKSDWRKCTFTNDTAQNNKELIKLGFTANVVLVCIFVDCRL